MVLIAVGVVAIVVIVAVAVRGIVDPPPGPTGDARYAHASDLCAVTDLDPVLEIQPWERVDTNPGHSDLGFGASTSSCRVFLSTPPGSDQYVTGSVIVYAIIYDDVSNAKRRFDGDVDDQSAPIREVDGPWHRAVLGLGSFLDVAHDDLLAILWVLDGNLRLEVDVTVDRTAAGVTEEQLATAAQRIATSVLQQLVQDPA